MKKFKTLKKSVEQITDDQGNNIHPTPDQLKLYKSGWRIAERYKRGAFRIVRWIDPTDGTVYSQSTAVLIWKQRHKQPRCAICKGDVKSHMPDGLCGEVDYAGGQRWTENLLDDRDDWKEFQKRWEAVKKRAGIK